MICHSNGYEIFPLSTLLLRTLDNYPGCESPSDRLQLPPQLRVHPLLAFVVFTNCCKHFVELRPLPPHLRHSAFPPKKTLFRQISVCRFSPFPH